jgi:putative ABC transport system permease protein
MCCPCLGVEPMTLFSLARKNIKGSFRSYLIYFISMLCSVVIYYTFVSLRYSKVIQDAMEVSQGVESIFLQASIILIGFVAVFIWYSNSVFTKKRKKEVGLYSLLGVRKRAIGQMLFYENLIMGVLVLAAGIVLGTFLSKLFAMILVKLVGSDVGVGLTLSMRAIGNTALVFFIIILMTSIQGYRLIYRFPLIELFQAEKKGEQAPKTSLWAAGCSVVLLGVAYWFILQPIATTEEYIRNNLIMLFSIVTGTYLLFRSLTVFLLKTAQKNKARYYSGMNLISTSQLLYRIQGNARLFTVIALLSAVTISSIGLMFSQYYVNSIRANEVMPFSYMHVSMDEAFDAKVRGMIMEDREHPVLAELDIPVTRMAGDLSDIEISVSDVREYESSIRLLSAGTYNRISKILNREEPELHLNGREAAIIKPMYTTAPASVYEGRSLSLKLTRGDDMPLALTRMLEGRVLSWSYPDFVLIVSDETFADLHGEGTPILYKAYKVEKDRTAKAASAELMALDSKDIQMATHYNVYKKGLESGGMDTFLIGFLGLVFLAAAGSMIYFKQLSEANEDRERYEILSKIGVSSKDISATVAKQSFFVFGLPLAVGLIHSAVLLKSFTGIYSDLMGKNIIVPVVLSMAAYIAIYLGYYVLTVQTYRRIVKR